MYSFLQTQNSLQGFKYDVFIIILFLPVKVVTLTSAYLSQYKYNLILCYFLLMGRLNYYKFR